MWLFSEYKHRNWLVNEQNVIEDPDRSLCNYRTKFVKKKKKAKASKQTSRKKYTEGKSHSLQQGMLGKLNIYMWKNGTVSLSLTLHKYQLKM